MNSDHQPSLSWLPGVHVLLVFSISVLYMFVQTGSGFIHVPVCSGLDEKFSAGDAGQLMMPDPDIVRQLTSVSYALDGASETLNRLPPEHLDLSSDQAQSQWFVLYGYYFLPTQRYAVIVLFLPLCLCLSQAWIV